MTLLLYPAQLAQLAGVSERVVYNWIDDKVIHSKYRVGKRARPVFTQHECARICRIAKLRLAAWRGSRNGTHNGDAR